MLEVSDIEDDIVSGLCIQSHELLGSEAEVASSEQFLDLGHLLLVSHWSILQIHCLSSSLLFIRFLRINFKHRLPFFFNLPAFLFLWIFLALQWAWHLHLIDDLINSPARHYFQQSVSADETVSSCRRKISTYQFHLITENFLQSLSSGGKIFMEMIVSVDLIVLDSLRQTQMSILGKQKHQIQIILDLLLLLLLVFTFSAWILDVVELS